MLWDASNNRMHQRTARQMLHMQSLLTRMSVAWYDAK
jgi:hypothetical protein